MRFGFLLPLSTLSALVAAHSMHQRRAPTLEELAREEINVRERAVMARNCEPEIREHMVMRMRRRAEIQRREAEASGKPRHAVRAHYTDIQNTTCLTAPEVTEGPYYVNNELVRQDITEMQQGAKLLMDFGVMDTTTCTPMNNAFVEIWHANANGLYGAYPSGRFNRGESWLRGGWYTDAKGIVEMTTIYPGFYEGRAPHIHLMVHKDWTQSSNGTLVSHSGSVVHVGQVFFEESWNDRVYQTSPYTSTTTTRTLNNQDNILGQSLRNGYSSFAGLQYLNGNDLSGGLVGYLTLGIDSRSSYTIDNRNYNGVSNGTTAGGSNGSTSTNESTNGSTDASTAQLRGRGWENTFFLSLLVFAFFGYGTQLVSG